MGTGDVDGVVEIEEIFIVESLKDDKDIIKNKNIIVYSTTNFVDTRIDTYKGREPIFRTLNPLQLGVML